MLLVIQAILSRFILTNLEHPHPLSGSEIRPQSIHVTILSAKPCEQNLKLYELLMNITNKNVYWCKTSLLILSHVCDIIVSQAYPMTEDTFAMTYV